MLIPLIMACHKKQINKKGDADLRVQISQIGAPDPSVKSFKVRIVPGKQIQAAMTYQLHEKLIFQMDSCFYLDNGTEKKYASLIQPIANGSGSILEYMVQFADTGYDDKTNLIYQDKYLNRKAYSFNMQNLLGSNE